MIKKSIVTNEAPKPAGPYSQGIVHNGMLFTAGFGPQDPATGNVADNVGDQTRQVLRNIGAVLKEAGASSDDVVKATVHLQHLNRDFPEFNAAYTEFFREPYPVRTTVGSDLANILVEIDVTVVLPPVGPAE